MIGVSATLHLLWQFWRDNHERSLCYLALSLPLTYLDFLLSTHFTADMGAVSDLALVYIDLRFDSCVVVLTQSCSFQSPEP